MFAQVRRCYYTQTQEIHLCRLQELSGLCIRHIATRFGQAFAVVDDGSVYAWGMKSGDSNRPEHECSMGHGEVETLLSPTPIPCFGPNKTPIRCVAAGASHALFVSIYGEAYSVGRCEYGKLGLGVSVTAEEHVVSPAKIAFPMRPAPKITTAAAGARHSLFLARSGEVWGCGFARSGALPTTWTLDADMLACAPKLLDRVTCFTTAIAAGILCSFFVSDCGRVFFTGAACQTPCPFERAEMADPAQPFCIPGLRGIEQVSVSMEFAFFQWEHALFACSDGSVFGWGHLQHGEFEPSLGAVCGQRKRCPCSRQCCKSFRDGFCNCVIPIRDSPPTEQRGTHST